MNLGWILVRWEGLTDLICSAVEWRACESVEDRDKTTTPKKREGEKKREIVLRMAGTHKTEVKARLESTPIAVVG